MRGVLSSLSPRFYSRFHQRRFLFALLYLLKLLVFYELLRFSIFYARNKSTLEAIRSEECVEAMIDGFPKDLTIQLRQKRFYFSKKTPIVLELPECLQEGFGMVSSYMSHGALTPDDVWTMVAPFVILIEKDKDFNRQFQFLQAKYVSPKTLAGKRALQRSELRRRAVFSQESETVDDFDDFETVFLVVTRRKALLLDMIPVGHIFRSFLQVASLVRGNEESDPSSSIDPDSGVVKLDRTILRNSIKHLQEEVNAESWMLPMIDAVLAVLLICGGFLVGVLSSFELLLTSTVMYVLIRQGRVGASFRFWTVKRHFGPDAIALGVTDSDLDREQEALLVTYLREWEVHPNGAIFSDLSDFFFIGISIHTATIGLIIDAFFPFPIAHTVGIGSIVHVFWTVVALRYFALPGFFMEKFVRQVLEARGRANRIAEVNVGGPSTETQTNNISRARIVNLTRRVETERQWRDFVFQQQDIVSLLRSESFSLGSKLTTVVARMQTIRKTIFANQVNIIHVWSRLNAGPDAVGGPGWCYGLSSSTGTWVLLCWYDHPCSDVGVHALAAFPGIVYIANGSNEPDVPNLLLPSTAEIEKLKERITNLQSQLDQIKTNRPNLRQR